MWIIYAVVSSSKGNGSRLEIQQLVCDIFIRFRRLISVVVAFFLLVLRLFSNCVEKFSWAIIEGHGTVLFSCACVHAYFPGWRTIRTHAWRVSERERKQERIVNKCIYDCDIWVQCTKWTSNRMCMCIGLVCCFYALVSRYPCERGRFCAISSNICFKYDWTTGQRQTVCTYTYGHVHGP